MYFSRFLRVKHIVRRVVEGAKKWDAMFFVSIPTIKYYDIYAQWELQLPSP